MNLVSTEFANLFIAPAIFRSVPEITPKTTDALVTEFGSFTKTAEELDYSQSTISFQVKQLEDKDECKDNKALLDYIIEKDFTH